MSLPTPPLLLITDRTHATRPLPEIVRAAFDGGCRWVMLRDKDLPAAERQTLAVALVDLAREHGATVLVNSDADLAETVGAQGVHLPAGRSIAAARRRLGPKAMIGASTHTGDEARAAALDGADYVTCSPVFESASKPGYGPPIGLDGLARIAADIPVPVLALGGITAGNATACRAAGAAGIAVMGGIMASPDPYEATRALITALVEVS